MSLQRAKRLVYGQERGELCFRTLTLLQCYNCHGYGHYARDCTRTLREAPGCARGNPASSTNSTVGAEQSSNESMESSSNMSIEQSSNMTTEQLEQMLAQHRLEQENSSMRSTSSNNARLWNKYIHWTQQV